MIYNNTLYSKQFLSAKTDQQMPDRHQISYPPSPPLSTSYMRSNSPNFKDSIQSNTQYHENSSNTKTLNLEKVIQNYAANPELLELILSSKVEEDRRRAEEAKLRSKEIDYILKKQEKEDFFSKKHNQQEQQILVPSPRYETNNEVPYSSEETTLPPIFSKYHNNSNSNNISSERRCSLSSASSSECSLPRIHYPSHHYSAQGSLKPYQSNTANTSFSSFGGWKNQLPAYTATAATTEVTHYKSPVSPKRNGSSNINMLLSPVSSPSESKQSDFSLFPTSKDKREPSNIHCQQQEVSNKRSYSDNMACESVNDIASAYKAEPSTYNKRRRRETQAITAIIETKEFPYNDDYLWKNNGNTTHKKSGFKSIYYKCTNSSKGCPVNKTVTFKDNGEHLIKYRGHHLAECNRIKRIIDVNK